MNRMLPKMKEAVVSLRKLDMLIQMPVSEDRSGNSKVNADVLESEDPSSESISTGSAESNVVCTDDDDLEKKIQAFSIPVKKDEEKPSSKTVNESIKSQSDKGPIIEKRKESIKSEKKQITKTDKTKERIALKIESRTSTDPTKNTSANDVSRATRRKKESTMKKKFETDNEKKPQPLEPEKGLKFTAGSSKLNEKNIERKTKKEELEDVVESSTGSDVSRKRKALNNENTQIQAKKLLAEKRNPKLPNEQTSAQNNEKNKRNMDVKLRSDSIKRKKIISFKDSSKLSDRTFVDVKRSTRMSASDNRATYIRKDTERKILRSKTLSKSIEVDENKPQKSKIGARERHSSSKDRSASKLITNENGKVGEKQIKAKELRKSISIGMGKKTTLNSELEEGMKALVKENSIKDTKQISSAKGKKKLEKISETKSGNFEKKIQKGSDVFDDGEELLEKICDLLEDASGGSESRSGEKRNGTQGLYFSNKEANLISNEKFLVPDPFFLQTKGSQNSQIPFSSQRYNSIQKTVEVVTSCENAFKLVVYSETS